MLDQKFHSWNTLVAETVAQSGTDSFFGVLIASICRFVSVKYPQIWLYECGKPPSLLYHEFQATEFDLHVDEYIEDKYKIAPFYLASIEPVEQGIYDLQAVSADHYRSDLYLHDYYSRMRVLDEICHIIPLAPGCVLNIALMRSKNSATFNGEDHVFLHNIEPLIRTLVQQHWKIYSKQTSQDLSHQMDQVIQNAIGKFGSSVLTIREQEVVKLSLNGHSIKTAAARLNISSDTLKKHRKHIYRKLDITSNSELYSIFIQALPPYASIPDQDPFTLFDN